MSKDETHRTYKRYSRTCVFQRVDLNLHIVLNARLHQNEVKEIPEWTYVSQLWDPSPFCHVVPIGDKCPHICRVHQECLCSHVTARKEGGATVLDISGGLVGIYLQWPPKIEVREYGTHGIHSYSGRKTVSYLRWTYLFSLHYFRRQAIHSPCVWEKGLNRGWELSCRNHFLFDSCYQGIGHGRIIFYISLLEWVTWQLQLCT